jgi:hypothetical protein
MPRVVGDPDQATSPTSPATTVPDQDHTSLLTLDLSGEPLGLIAGAALLSHAAVSSE